MENIESMLDSIRFRILDETTERLEEKIIKKGFTPNDAQITEIGKIVAKEVTTGTLNQIESALDTEIDLSVDFIWDIMCDEMNINEAPVNYEDDVWEDEDGHLESEFIEPEENAEPDLPKTGKCPGCCEKVEKIDEIEGIQSHIVDMEW